MLSDLNVELLSDALEARKLDIVVSGSIGAVESVRFIRALRRLGAEVTPWLTAGGAQFITPMALEWAANHKVRSEFSGIDSHIATGDACILAPASADFVRKVAQGVTDSPTSALVASYLGAKKPVIVVPNMHSSLYQSPVIQEHVQKLAQIGVLLPPRSEENKQKFPEPAVLADKVAHHLNLHSNKAHKVLLNMGSTRGYIDDVRYVSNYSSGGLGTKVAEELYRQGFQTTVICGSAQIQPQVYDKFLPVLTNAEMEDALVAQSSESFDAVVYLASVLDFTPNKKIPGKISSSQPEMHLDLVPTKKLLTLVQPRKGGVKIAFKLGVDVKEGEIASIAERYITHHRLDLLIYNDLRDVSATQHSAQIFFKDAGVTQKNKLKSKPEIARFVAQFIKQSLG